MLYGVKFIIHAIAPTQKEGLKKTPLIKTVKKALDEADNLNCATVAFPAICAGLLLVNLVNILIDIGCI